MGFNFDEHIERNNTNSLKYGVGRMLHPNLPEEHIPMWVADMDFACPQPVLDAMKGRLDKRILGYSMLLDEEYYMAVMGWMKRRYDWDVPNPDSIVFSSGIVTALDVAAAKLTKPGEGILFHTPSYAPFYNAILKSGRTPVALPLIEEDGWYTMDFDAFEAEAKKPENTLYFLCNPFNPVGRVWTEDELRRIGEICFANNVFVVSDEIHADFRRAGQKHIPLAKLFPEEKRMMTCTAPSKSFNLAGNQLSNLIIPDEMMALEWKFMHYCGMPNPLSIEACKAAYTQCDDWMDALNVYIEESQNHLVQRLQKELPALKMRVPEGTYFGWIDVRGLGISEDALAHTLYEAGLFIEMGSEFVSNGDGFVRMNLACPRATIDRAVDILVACFKEDGSVLAELRTRKKLAAGDVMPNFTYDTPFEKGVDFETAVGSKKTALVFLRYYGCTLCQLDLMALKEEYAKIEASGGQVKVVLQSDPAGIAESMGGQNAFPFDIICDPEQKLYRLFDIAPARSQADMLGPEAMMKMGKAKMMGIEHGAYEGNEQQLPACFIVEPGLKVNWAHYGQNAGDSPDPDTLAGLLK